MLKIIIKIIGISLGALFALGILIVIVLMVLSVVHENQTKNRLSKELKNLNIPKNCEEKNRQYTEGGLDSGDSHWIISYTCNNITVREENAYITNRLIQLGFKNPYANLPDIYAKDKTELSYSLNTLSNQHPKQQKAETSSNNSANIIFNSLDINNPISTLQKKFYEENELVNDIQLTIRRYSE